MTQRAGAHCFVVPPLDGPITGGTRYNAELIGALGALGVQPRVLDAQGARALADDAAPERVWVDSLYLEQLPELRACLPPRTLVCLLAHYLPSLVRYGADVRREQLSAVERRVLEQADAFIVTGGFLRDKLRELVASERPIAPIVLIEPGSTGAPPSEPLPCADVRALLIANLTPGKNVEPFLEALARELRADDPWRLAIVGSPSLDPEYAARCRALVAREPQLRERVVFTGALAPEQVLARLAAANLMISASAMESYGMALRDARTLGVPILARAGGNVAALVDARAGGQLAHGDAELARACVALARAPGEHAARYARARASALPARSWSSVAHELLAASARLA